MPGSPKSLVGSACAALAAFCCLLPPCAFAQSPYGYGTYVTLPVVAQTGTYSTEIYLTGSPQSFFSAYQAIYYGADGSATPGKLQCSTFAVGANSQVRTLPDLCPGLNPGSNFGLLTFRSAGMTDYPMSAYARVTSTAGNGFSIEGFPDGTLANGKSDSLVQGLKRIAAAPGYQSNCFVSSIGEAVTVNMQLETFSGAVLGAPLTLSLSPAQSIRLLDVFAAVGAPAGDHSAIRARFRASPSAGSPSYVAFCTVQNNTSFDADFRIAKVFQTEGDDQTKLLAPTVTFASGITRDLGERLLPDPVKNAVNGVEHRWAIYFQHPDRVRCTLTDSVPPDNASMLIVDPTGLVNGAVSVPGCGAKVDAFLGRKSTINNGVNGRWYVKVTSCTTDVPLTGYTLTCTSGSGASSFTYGGYASPSTF